MLGTLHRAQPGRLRSPGRSGNVPPPICKASGSPPAGFYDQGHGRVEERAQRCQAT
jgi:hypothetical protein